MEKVSKEKMDSISKDLEKLESNLEGLSEEQLKEVSAGLNATITAPIAIGLLVGANILTPAQ